MRAREMDSGAYTCFQVISLRWHGMSRRWDAMGYLERETVGASPTGVGGAEIPNCSGKGDLQSTLGAEFIEVIHEQLQQPLWFALFGIIDVVPENCRTVAAHELFDVSVAVLGVLVGVGHVRSQLRRTEPGDAVFKAPVKAPTVIEPHLEPSVPGGRGQLVHHITSNVLVFGFSAKGHTAQIPGDSRGARAPREGDHAAHRQATQAHRIHGAT